MPPAPPTFSTTTCWPRISLIRCAMTRPSTSVGPPAANGMIIVIGLAGEGWASGTLVDTSRIPHGPAMVGGTRLIPDLSISLLPDVPRGLDFGSGDGQVAC